MERGSKNLCLSLPGDHWTAMDLVFPVMVTDHDWFLAHFICKTRSETHLEAGWCPRPLNPLQCQPTQVGTTYTPNACSLQGMKFVLSCFSLFFFLILSSSCKAKLYFSKVSPIKKNLLRSFYLHQMRISRHMDSNQNILNFLFKRKYISWHCGKIEFFLLFTASSGQIHSQRG